MYFNISRALIIISISAIPVLFAIIVHEVAHGWVANKCGDPTAKIMGRLTLNPFKHISLLGTVIVPLFLAWVSGFIFGWAKPVPINVRGFKNPRHDLIWVALAGPIANIIMVVLWGIILKLSIVFMPAAPMLFLFIGSMAKVGVSVNVVLAIFNLIPIPPLDGSRVVSCILSQKAAYNYNKLERYGFFIIILLLVTGVFGKVFMPFVHFLLMHILRFFGM